MTMKNYIDELINSIPTPETLQQEQLEKIIERILCNLRFCGWYQETNFNVGSREAEINMVNRVKKIFSDKGYSVSLSFYSENNRKVFFLQIEL